MSGFTFKETDFQGAFLIENFYVGDNRGGFTKSFEKDIYKDAGIEFHLNETFVSRSMKNVIRGLHFQFHNPQAKLISVVTGSVWDVIVDLRKGSPTFKQWRSFDLSANNHLGLFIPKGFAHGFASIENDTIMLYQCDGKYDARSDTGIMYNEPILAIDWPVGEKVAIHSKRDLGLMDWKDYIVKVSEEVVPVWGGGGQGIAE